MHSKALRQLKTHKYEFIILNTILAVSLLGECLKFTLNSLFHYFSNNLVQKQAKEHEIFEINCHVYFLMLLFIFIKIFELFFFCFPYSSPYNLTNIINMRKLAVLY